MGAIARRRFARAFTLAFALCTAFVLLPAPAYADIAGEVNSWLCDLLRDTCDWIFKGQVEILRSIGIDGVLSAGFDQMLGTSLGVTMHDIARGTWEVAILPIGCGILSFVFTMQLIKISQRMDGNASMPGVKEVVFLLVFLAVFTFLLQNSFELMRAVYEVVRLAIHRVAGLYGSGGSVDLSNVSLSPL